MGVIAVDPFKGQRTSQDKSARGGFAVTPSDTDELVKVTRQLWIRGTGDLTVSFADGTKRTYTAVAADKVLNWSVRQVWATGTTATNIEAFY